MARRILVAGPALLLAEGVMAALRGVQDWEVLPGSEQDDADAWIVLGEDLMVRSAHGAVAQLALDASPARLRAAVSAVLEGLSVRETPWQMGPAPHEPLTRRELEVFELMGNGRSNRDIAQALGISVHTAKYHVSQILAKVGAATRAEAVSEGLRWGLIGL